MEKRAKWIPRNWTFRSRAVASRFDRHVREQLPWYDLATESVAHFGRHYIPSGGMVYDIGASTGNIGNALRGTIAQRNAKLIGIEESREMAAKYRGPGTVVVANALEYEYEHFDFAVLFLVMMFFPVARRKEFVDRLTRLINPGGAILIVDKINTASGYFGTAARRLSMQWKIATGVSAGEIIEKELSLAGYQRPIDPERLLRKAKQFFQFGEFAGWVIESEKKE